MKGQVLGGHRRVHQLDESILKAIPGLGRTFESKRDMMGYLLCTTKVVSLNQLQRGWAIQSLKTDGCSVSVLLKRPRGCQAAKKSRGAAEPVIPEDVVAVDPGRRSLVTFGTVGHDMDTYTPSVSISTRSFYSASGYSKRSFITSKDMKKDEVVRDFNKSVTTANTPDEDEYVERLLYVLERIDHLTKFHGLRKYKKLRFNTSILRKKTIDSVCKKISQGKSSTTVAFGDASVNHGGRGLMGPMKEIRRRLETHHCVVIDVDEFRTSKLCSKCHDVVESIQVVQRTWSEEGLTCSLTSPHALRVCFNPLCRTVWDRDVNAVRNIGYKCMKKALEGRYPPAFDRPVLVSEDDGV